MIKPLIIKLKFKTEQQMKKDTARKGKNNTKTILNPISINIHLKEIVKIHIVFTIQINQ